jgi:hypothetical protein
MNKKIKFSIIFLLFAVLLALYSFFSDLRKEKLLENSKNTFGIIKVIDKGSVRGTPFCKFEYKVEKEFFNSKEYGEFSNLSLNDTVLIKYSVDDPSVARVVDKYYMKKYRHLKKR